MNILKIITSFLVILSLGGILYIVLRPQSFTDMTFILILTLVLVIIVCMIVFDILDKNKKSIGDVGIGNLMGQFIGQFFDIFKN